MTQITTAEVTAERMPEYVARLLSRFDSATPDQAAEGRAWYPVTGQLAEIIGAGDQDAGAGVIAALSLRTPWEQNVRQARQLAAGAEVRTLTMNLDRARMILAGDPWQTVLPEGSKTWNFAHNILGHDDHVTVDVWMVRAAVGAWDVSRIKLDRHDAYATMAEAVRQAAAARNVSPAVMQATVWVVTRAAGRAGLAS